MIEKMPKSIKDLTKILKKSSIAPRLTMISQSIKIGFKILLKD